MIAEQPIEIFALQLARLMKRRDWRILRGLSAEDKDEVIARAVLAAWEKREELDTDRGAVEVWFNFILRDARRNWANEYASAGEDLSSVQQLQFAVESANPETILEAEQESEEFFAKLDTPQRSAVSMLAKGESVKQIEAATHVPRKRIGQLRRQIRRIGAQPQRVLPTERAPRGLAEDRDQRPARIDREIGAWLRGGLHRVTGLCRPCLACAWFDGFKNYSLYPHRIVDAEVAKAVADTLDRKLIIAKGLNSGITCGTVEAVEVKQDDLRI